MAPSSKTASAAKDRRKSANTKDAKTTAVDSVQESSSPAKSTKSSKIVTLQVPSDKLRAIVDPASLVKEETPVPPVKDAKDSPATSTTLPAATNSNGENASDSNPATPAASGTPAPQLMGPPTEGPKKKGVKRAAGAANGNGEPKARGKPGPKKKQRVDDGLMDAGGRMNGLGAHKLGPKANQGAINAGLRALDRSGKPCRKWNKGGFTLKSFTGVVWEVPRWTAPPRPKPEEISEQSASASADGSSSKENKENGPVKSDGNSNIGGDVEMQSVPSMAAANSPAPVPIAAA